jgi:RNA polymerase sigma-70 factor (ECF subfamily)
MEHQAIVLKVFKGNEKKYRNYALYLCRYDSDKANDLIQDVLLRLLENPNYSEKEIEGIFTTCIHNLYMDKYRNNKRKFGRCLFFDDLEKVGVNGEDCNPSLIDEPSIDLHTEIDLKELLKFGFVKNLKHREILKKHYCAGLNYNELVDELGWNLGTVKSQLFRAKQKVMTNDMVKEIIDAT